MQSFNHTGHYVCECGREFNKSQSYNAHRSHCKIVYLNKYGNLDKLNEKDHKISEKAIKSKAEKLKIKKELEFNTWLEEKHVCETCGKIMTEKFGSGRFCSRSCANTHKHSDETRNKIGKSIKKWNIEHPEEAYNNAVKRADAGNNSRRINKLGKHKQKLKRQELKKELNIPEVEDEIKNREPGWQSRSIKNSYPEQFWMKVFDNNNINYIREYMIPCEHPGAVYKFDFFINNKFDIEIDGSQHLEESVKLKDCRRDSYLESLGYTVIRIPWINPNTEENCKLVKFQIDEVLSKIK